MDSHRNSCDGADSSGSSGASVATGNSSDTGSHCSNENLLLDLSQPVQGEQHAATTPSGQIVDDPLLSSTHSTSHPDGLIECDDDNQGSSTHTHHSGSVSLGGGRDEAAHALLGGGGLSSPLTAPMPLSGYLKVSEGGAASPSLAEGAGEPCAVTRASRLHEVETSSENFSAADNTKAMVGGSISEWPEIFGRGAAAPWAEKKGHVAVHPVLSQAGLKPTEKRVDDDEHVSKEISNADGGKSYGIVARDEKVSSDAHVRAGKNVRKQLFSEILQQAKNPGGSQADVSGHAEGIFNQAAGHDQGRSWAEVTARGTNVGHKEGLVAFAGERGRLVPGGSARSASKVSADGASEPSAVHKTVSNFLDFMDSMLDPGREEHEEIRQCPKAFLAWVVDMKCSDDTDGEKQMENLREVFAFHPQSHFETATALLNNKRLGKVEVETFIEVLRFILSTGVQAPPLVQDPPATTDDSNVRLPTTTDDTSVRSTSDVAIGHDNERAHTSKVDPSTAVENTVLLTNSDNDNRHFVQGYEKYVLAPHKSHDFHSTGRGFGESEVGASRGEGQGGNGEGKRESRDALDHGVEDQAVCAIEGRAEELESGCIGSIQISPLGTGATPVTSSNSVPVSAAQEQKEEGTDQRLASYRDVQNPELSFSQSDEESADGDEDLLLKKQNLTQAARGWILRRWGDYSANSSCASKKARRRRNKENNQQLGNAVVIMESLCYAVSALVALPVFREAWSCSVLLDAVKQDTWPFRANSRLQLLVRVCQVLGGLGDSADDGAESVAVESQPDVLAPEVMSLLHRVAKGLVGIDFARSASLSGPSGGFAKGALVAIHEHLDLTKHCVALELVHEVVVRTISPSAKCRNTVGLVEELKDPDLLELDLDEIISKWDLWVFFLDWVGSAPSDFAGSGLDTFAAKIRQQSRAAASSIMDGNILCGQLQQFTHQADSIAKLCEAGTENNGHEEGGDTRVAVAASSLHSKLKSYKVALDDFSITLDGAKILATLYCPAIEAYDASSRLGATVTELVAQVNNGVLPLRELSQASLLSAVMTNVPEDADAVPLKELSILSNSTVFANVWQTAGMNVLRELNGESDDVALPLPVGATDNVTEAGEPDDVALPSPVEAIDNATEVNAIDAVGEAPGDDELDSHDATLKWGEQHDWDDALDSAQETEGAEDQHNDGGIATEPDTPDEDTLEGEPAEAVSLDLDAIITRVIPAALKRWGEVVDRCSRGEIAAEEACITFAGSARDREEQVRKVFAWSAGHRVGNQAAPQTAGFGSARFLAALEAQASITWFLDAAPKLLDAQVVLYSASKRADTPAAVAEAANPGATESTGDTRQGDDRVSEFEIISSTIFATPVGADASRTSLEGILQTLQMHCTRYSIGEASVMWNDAEDWGPRVVSGSKRRQRGHGKENRGFLGRCRPHIDLLSALSKAADLVDWLVKHPSTEEFDQLLQVCRPCTDDPRLLSSLASLVEIRTRLLTVLFPETPFDGLEHLLQAFAEVDLQHSSGSRIAASDVKVQANPGDVAAKAMGPGAPKSLTWHVVNTMTRFPGLMQLIEKQTVSPGTQALRSLGSILKHGWFHLCTSPSSDTGSKSQAFALSLALPSEACGGDVSCSAAAATVLDQEKLLGLSARLSIMEVPEDVEKAWAVSHGHGARVVANALHNQLQTADNILQSVKDLHDAGHPDYYQRGWEMRVRFEVQGCAGLDGSLVALKAQCEMWADEVSEARDTWPWLNHLTMQDVLLLNRYRLDALRAADASGENVGPLEFPDEAISAVAATLRLVFSGARRETATRFMSIWVGNVPDESLGDDSTHSQETMLSSLGAALTKALGEAAKLGCGPASRLLPVPPPETANASDGLVATAWGTGGLEEGRRNSVSGSSVSTAVQAGGRARQCLFASCTPGPDEVIVAVLSIYVRRGRLPEPGEVLFCTSVTTDEELELAVRRFAGRRESDEESAVAEDSVGVAANDDGIFVIANIHHLSYSSQAVLLRHLRSKVLACRNDDAGRGHGGDAKDAAGGAVLLVLSGEPQQALLNWLGGHVVELPPLPMDVLRDAVAVALERHHGGTTRAIKSEINGGGKTHHIMEQIAAAQAGNPTHQPPYIRIPVGESFSPSRLSHALASRELRQGVDTYACHLDLGYVPPPDCNVFLFQLLVEGCVRDPVSREVIVRWAGDSYFVEIANSENERTARLLHVCNLLPTTLVKVGCDQLDLKVPVLKGTTVNTIVDDAILRTCRWLRASVNGGLLPNSQSPDPGDCEDVPSKEECFELLRRCCCVEGGPSERPTWALFRTFARLMSHQLHKVEQYPLLGAAIASDGLEMFRDVFLRLLIETTKDFSLRSVPQINLQAVGPSVGATDSDNLKAAVGGADVASTSSGGESLRLAARCQAMAGWQDSDHPVVVFKMDDAGSDISGIDILSLNRHERRGDTCIEGQLKEALQLNGIDFDKDWTTITREEAVKLLRDVGTVTAGGVRSRAMESGYVFTVDNFLKMLSITMRLEARIPVVIMGETGCGKSSLVCYMCEVLGWKLHVLNVHSGLSYDDIAEWVEACAAECEAEGDGHITVALLDEINACDSCDLFKEIVCDGAVNGKPLPVRLHIVAACNPYRLRKRAGDGGGVSGENHGGVKTGTIGLANGTKDTIRDLVYRVHPLPESVVDCIVDYGSLGKGTESLYIAAMVKNLLRDDAGDRGSFTEGPCDAMVRVFSRCLCTAQESTRSACGGERATVSLRDVSRCIKVFLWFGKLWVEHGPNFLVGDERFAGGGRTRSLSTFFSCREADERLAVKEAMVLALGYSYQARLPRDDRRRLVHEICMATDTGVGSRWLRTTPTWFCGTMSRITTKIAGSMELGEGIATNEALLENLFVLLVSVLNSIPVFVVGKPGSSKSLAVSILQANLKGRASSNEFLRSFPAVALFFHQCSPQSTSQGILQTFKAARTYRESAPNTVVVILLDEIGLAEMSPHLPLKVVHKMLDEAKAGETLLGISNWELDPAKMNRGVHLHRPPPTVADLTLTAEGMLRCGGGVGSRNDVSTGGADMGSASGLSRDLMKGVAESYETVSHEQKLEGFWGLRDFYATVKYIGQRTEEERLAGARLDERSATTTATLRTIFKFTKEKSKQEISDATLACAVLRNFGGRRRTETRAVLELFFRKLLRRNPPPPENLPNVAELVHDNLAATQARHLMLLTKNNAALSLLFDLKLLDHADTEVLFGSDFPGDTTDMQVSVDIQTVKACMARGATIVLVQCDRLYESLYPLLNQHYAECAGQLFVTLAMGAHSQLCRLDPKFRVVVVVETVDAYEKLAPPLLNRFEKQVLGWQQSLALCQPRPLFERLLERVELLTFGLAAGHTWSDAKTPPPREDLRRAFPGYGTAFLPSLILAVSELARDGLCGGDVEGRTRTGGAPASWKDRATRMLNSFKGSVGGARETPNRASDDNVRGGALGDGAEECRSGHRLDEDGLYDECARRLLRVVTPEAMCQLKGRRGRVGGHRREGMGRDLEQAADEFKRQAHGSLEEFSKSALQVLPSRGTTNPDMLAAETAGPVGGCTVVMTYAPLEGDTAAWDLRSPAGGAWSVCHVVIHELSQAKELSAKVKAFFSRKAVDEVLLLECDLLASPIRIVEHVKFVVENARASFVKDCLHGDGDGKDDENGTHGKTAWGEQRTRGVHVVLLLHLIRGGDEFTHSFDTRWKCAFVDSVGDEAWGEGGAGEGKGAGGLPSAVDASGKSILEVVTDLEPSRVLLLALRPSLAQLAFSPERRWGMAEVRSQMETLLEACGGRAIEAFPQAAWKAILGRISLEEQKGTSNHDLEDGLDGYVEVRGWEETKGDTATEQEEKRAPSAVSNGRSKGRGRGADVALAASSDQQLHIAGTFRRAIRTSVLAAVTRAFSAVLAHMDRNAGLHLLNEESLREKWIALFQDSFNDMSDEILTAPRRELLGETARDGDEFPRGLDSLLGLRGEVRFRVLDSSAGPGEPLCRSMFPFSFYVFRLLQGLQTSVANGGQGGGSTAISVSEEALRRKFGLLHLSGNLHTTLLRATGPGVHGVAGAASDCGQGEDFLRRYAHDFTCLLLPSVRRVSRADQARYLLALLDLAGPGCLDQGHELRVSRQKNAQNSEGCREMLQVAPSDLEGESASGWTPVQSLAAVHHRFWRVEDAVRLHFKLLDAAGPDAFAPATTVVEARLLEVRQGSSAGGLDPHIHLMVARAVQVALLDVNPFADISEQQSTPSGAESTGESSAVWASNVDGADRATKNMVVPFIGHDKPRASIGSGGESPEDDYKRAHETLVEEWARLRIMRKLVVNVTAPLPFELPPQATRAAIKTLREGPLPVRSREFLEAVVLSLVDIAVLTQLYLCSDSATGLTGSDLVRGSHTSAQPDLVWDLFPRYLEGYISTIIGAATGADPVHVSHEMECAEQETAFCATFVALLSGDASYFIARSGSPFSDNEQDISDILARVLPREAASVEGLRWLWVKSRDSLGTASGDCLRVGLWREFERAGGSCDNKLAACFAVAVEEETSLDQALTFIDEASRSRGHTDIAHGSETALGDEDLGVALEQALTAVACLRTLASAAAEALCSGGDDAGRLVQILFGALNTDRATPALSPIHEWVGSVRNSGMFFLRQVASLEAGGEAFLREQLCLEPLSLVRWTRVDSRISAFMAGSRLPQVNPLVRIRLFHECRTLLAGFMDSGDVAELNDCLKSLTDAETAAHGASGTSNDGLADLKGGLLAGVFHEANLVAAVGRPNDDRLENRVRLEAWLLQDPGSLSLSFLTPHEKRVIAAFVGAPGAPTTTADGAEAETAREVLRLSQTSTSEDILWARLVAHVAAVVVSSSPTSPTAIFSDMALRPDVLREVYLPTMDTALNMQELVAMAGSHGGTNHQCACGYIYWVGECGQPMENRVCPERDCGRILGGTHHKEAQAGSSHIKLAEARGYCLDHSQGDASPVIATRVMSAEEVAATRFIMHTAGIVGAAAATPPGWANKARAMLNTGSRAAPRAGVGGEGVTAMFLRAARADAATLRRLSKRNIEQVALGIHLSLLGVQGGGALAGQTVSGTDSTIAPVALLRDEAGRSTWEAAFRSQHLSVISGDPALVGGRLATAAEELRRGADDAAFVAELLTGEVGGSQEVPGEGSGWAHVPRQDVTNAGDATVARSMNTQGARARLWGLRRSFSLESFMEAFAALGRGRNDKERPLLSMLANEDRRPARLALANLPAAMKWVQILKHSFEGKVNCEQARAWTAGRVLDTASAGDRGAWQAAFHGFCEAWRQGRGMVDRWECEDIPSCYALDSVGHETPLSVFLPSLQDEGIFPLALLTRLAEEHNEILRRSREATSVGGEAAVDEVRPMHLTGAQAIVLDVGRQASLLRSSQCGGTLGVQAAYDFDRAEAHLAQATLWGVPMIRMATDEITFKYVGERSTGETLLGKLGEKISQKRLTKGDREAIVSDLSTPALAQSLLDTIDPAIGILASVGGNLVKALPTETAETTVADFLRDVLLMGDDAGWEGQGVGSNCGGNVAADLNGGRTDEIGDDGVGRSKGRTALLPPSVARHVRLKHLCDLWELTFSRTERDWSAGLCPRFREKMSVDMSRDLAAASEDMDLRVLLPLFKGYTREYLMEGSSTASAGTIKDNLHWLASGDSWLGDLPWFTDNFPGHIEMRYALSAFRLLEELRPID